MCQRVDRVPSVVHADFQDTLVEEAECAPMFPRVLAYEKRSGWSQLGSLFRQSTFLTGVIECLVRMRPRTSTMQSIVSELWIENASTRCLEKPRTAHEYPTFSVLSLPSEEPSSYLSRA